MSSFLINYHEQLKKIFSNPNLELRTLLNNSSINKREIFLNNFKIEDINLIAFINAFNRRINREPISKIYNKKSFWKYNFFVNNNVLDPRPETETIIEKILEYYPNKQQSLKILDMCTGSGCLAISVAKEYLNSKVTATDISSKALAVAEINAKKFDCINQIEFTKCDLIKKISKYDIVLSNPPYLSEDEYSKTQQEIKLFEPKIALLAPNHGYGFYERISVLLPYILSQKGYAFIEIGSSQAKKVIQIFKSNNLRCIKVEKDTQKLNRVLILNNC